MTKILWHYPQADGTAYYRSYPWKRVSGIELVPANSGKKEVTWTDLYDIDICFFQRPASTTEVRLIDYCKKFNKKIICDYDDYTLEIVNPTNPAAPYYDRDSIRAATKECIRMADVVTVSTEGLRTTLLDHVPTANIVVVPNAIDDKMFDFSPVTLERNNIIAMRGGSSHKLDWEAYKPGILELLSKFPDHKLAVMGYHPDWLKEVPSNQILYYEFSNIPTYFETLMNLRPKVVIVPLTDDKFNRCKSAINLYEGVISGAVVCSTKLPEFQKYGSEWFTGSVSSFVKTISDVLAMNHSDFDWLYKYQWSKVPRLSDINEIRKDIVEGLLVDQKKYRPVMPEIKIATSEEFHTYELSRGWNQEDIFYDQAHQRFADWVVKIVNPKTSVEYGAGNGGSLLHLLRAGVMAYGLEISPIAVEYFQEHHPMYANQIKLADITKETVELDEPSDFGYSIEVFEHINESDEFWNKFISDLSTKYKKFYFSSTPYHTTQTWDTFWGHCNIRRTSDWVKLFEANGWKFLFHPGILTDWDCLFESTVV